MPPKKFAPPAHPIEQEASIPDLRPPEKLHTRQRNRYLREAYNASTDTSMRDAIATHFVDDLVKGIESKIQSDWKDDYRAWLMGNSPYNNKVSQTPWGRQNLLFVPGVKEFLNSELDKHWAFRKALLELQRNGPGDNLNHTYLYYKYIVRAHEWIRMAAKTGQDPIPPWYRGDGMLEFLDQYKYPSPPDDGSTDEDGKRLRDPTNDISTHKDNAQKSLWWVDSARFVASKLDKMQSGPGDADQSDDKRANNDQLEYERLEAIKEAERQERDQVFVEFERLVQHQRSIFEAYERDRQAQRPPVHFSTQTGYFHVNDVEMTDVPEEPQAGPTPDELLRQQIRQLEEAQQQERERWQQWQQQHRDPVLRRTMILASVVSQWELYENEGAYAYEASMAERRFLSEWMLNEARGRTFSEEEIHVLNLIHTGQIDRSRLEITLEDEIAILEEAANLQDQEGGQVIHPATIAAMREYINIQRYLAENQDNVYLLEEEREMLLQHQYRLLRSAYSTLSNPSMQHDLFMNLRTRISRLNSIRRMTRDVVESEERIAQLQRAAAATNDEYRAMARQDYVQNLLNAENAETEFAQARETVTTAQTNGTMSAEEAAHALATIQQLEANYFQTTRLLQGRLAAFDAELERESAFIAARRDAIIRIIREIQAADDAMDQQPPDIEVPEPENEPMEEAAATADQPNDVGGVQIDVEVEEQPPPEEEDEQDRRRHRFRRTRPAGGARRRRPGESTADYVRNVANERRDEAARAAARQQQEEQRRAQESVHEHIDQHVPAGQQRDAMHEAVDEAARDGPAAVNTDNPAQDETERTAHGMNGTPRDTAAAATRDTPGNRGGVDPGITVHNISPEFLERITPYSQLFTSLTPALFEMDREQFTTFFEMDERFGFDPGELFDIYTHVGRASGIPRDQRTAEDEHVIGLVQDSMQTYRTVIADVTRALREINAQGTSDIGVIGQIMENANRTLSSDAGRLTRQFMLSHLVPILRGDEEYRQLLNAGNHMGLIDAMARRLQNDTGDYADMAHKIGNVTTFILALMSLNSPNHTGSSTHDLIANYARYIVNTALTNRWIATRVGELLERVERDFPHIPPIADLKEPPPAGLVTVADRFPADRSARDDTRTPVVSYDRNGIMYLDAVDSHNAIPYDSALIERVAEAAGVPEDDTESRTALALFAYFWSLNKDGDPVQALIHGGQLPRWVGKRLAATFSVFRGPGERSVFTRQRIAAFSEAMTAYYRNIEVVGYRQGAEQLVRAAVNQISEALNFGRGPRPIQRLYVSRHSQRPLQNNPAAFHYFKQSVVPPAPVEEEQAPPQWSDEIPEHMRDR